MRNRRYIKRTFALQHNYSDCGVACLLSVIQYYGGEYDRMQLERQTGTGINGTTFLGLLEGAKKCGFVAEGVELDIAIFSTIKFPAILHVLVEDRNHFIVCYGKMLDGDRWLIGDPAQGLTELNTSQLEAVWVSRACLLLNPLDSFFKRTKIRVKKASWLLTLMKSDLYYLAPALLAGVIVTVLGLSTALFTQKLVDKILPAGDGTRLSAGIAVLAILLTGRLLINHLRKQLLVHQRKEFNIRLNGSFITRLFSLPRQFFDTHSTGDIISRVHDTAIIQENISNITLNVLDDGILVIIGLFFVGTYSPVTALSIVVLIGLLFVFACYYNPVWESLHSRLRQAFSRTETSYIECFKGIDAVKENNKTGYFSNQIIKTFQQYQAEIFTFGGVSNKFTLISDFAAAAALLLIMGIASYQVINNQLTPGGFVAIISLTGTIAPAVLRLQNIWIGIKESTVAFDRMYHFTSGSQEVIEDGQQGVVAPCFLKLTIENLSFGFPGKAIMLKDVNLEVGRGELVVISGKTGSGKSTLLLILQKYYSPVGGKVYINGTNLQGVDAVSLRNEIAFVPQEVKLFSGLLYENILFGSTNISSEALDEFLTAYGFDKFFKSLPNGIHTKVGENGIKLSGGQKQLVGLARALLRKPGLLLLDEPTTAMDVETEQDVIKLLLNLRSKGLTLIIVSHRFEALTGKADRVYKI